MRLVLCACVVLLLQIARGCDNKQPLDAVFVLRHLSPVNAAFYAGQKRWVLESARFLGQGVLHRDTKIGPSSLNNASEASHARTRGQAW